MAEVDEARYRQVGGHFATGVSIVTAVESDEPVGFTAQTLTMLSMNPPLVSVNPNKTSTTWPRIQAAGSFCVNILSHEQEALCRAFAVSGAPKFDGIEWARSRHTGSPVFEGILAWIDCEIEAVYDGGDHSIVVARVLDLDVVRDAAPLIFYRGGFGRFEA